MNEQLMDLAINGASAPPSHPLPTGTLTFLLTDIEGSTRLWEQHPVGMRSAMARHDKLIEAIVVQHRGAIVRPRGEGDSRFAVFPRATDAAAAASAIQRALYAEPWPVPSPLRVRMALHTGEAELRDGDYYGPAVNRCARLRNAAHGGQTLVSMVTHSLVVDYLPDGVSLRDLGQQQLKDLKRPEHIYQLVPPGLPSDFPALKVVGNARNNLPIALTRFIGRETEMSELKGLVRTARLLTITGVGGAGKTRLALEVGAALVDSFKDGVWLIDLAPLTNPQLVVQLVADKLSIREEEGRALSQTLIEATRTKEVLLILDNCEHLIQDVTELADGLLRNAPGLHILATGREPLGILGETIWRIPPLTSPDARGTADIASLAHYEAVQLFVCRATAVKSEFKLTKQNAPAVVQICARLEGIPLAIELAAARVKVLSVEEIAARLDDCFRFLVNNNRTALTRQQTLRALIDWSYDLLTDKERLLLRRLSVFAGGWTLRAAEEVCSGEGIDTFEVLDLLTHLIDKSLVTVEHKGEADRYRFLEIMRQYAQERLQESEEAEDFLHRHAEYFMVTAEKAYGKLWGSEQAYWLKRHEEEHDNLRAALEWAHQDVSRAEMLLRIARSLWRFWEIHGYISEGRSWLERALSVNPYASANLRANGLRGAGRLAYQQGDYLQAKSLHSQSLALFREMEDKLGIARQLDALGEVAQQQGDYQDALDLHAESLALRSEIGDMEGVAESLGQIGVIARDHGQYQSARELLEESLKLNRQRGDKLYTARSLNNLGLVAHFLCEYERAFLYYEEALTIFHELNDRQGISNTLQHMAIVRKDQGDFRQAKDLYNKCLDLRQGLGDKRGIARATAGLAEIAFFQGYYPRAAELSKQSLSIFRELGVKRGIVICLVTRTFTAHYQGDFDGARSLAEESLTLAMELDFPLMVAYAKEALGLGAFAQGQLARASELHQEALAIFRKIGDTRNVAHILVNLARTAYRQKDLSGATQYLEESLSISRQLDIRWTLALALEIGGLLQRSSGNYERACELFQESLALSWQQDNQQGIANCLGALAGLASMTGQSSRSARLFAAADKLRQTMGMKMGKDDQHEYEEHRSKLRHQMDAATFGALWSEGSAMALEQVVREAMSFGQEEA